MRKFVRENPTLAFGLGLPLLLVAVFAAAAWAPRLGAEPPRYGVLFASNYYPYAAGGNGPGFALTVGNRKLEVTYVGEPGYVSPPRLYLYQPGAETLREITITLPPALRRMPCIDKTADKAKADCADRKTQTTAIPVPALGDLKLDDAVAAPDGYVFASGDNYPHGLFLSSLFFSHSYQPSAALVKGNYKFRLPPAGNDYYAQLHFIGWIMP